jgi:hypothetical protein
VFTLLSSSEHQMWRAPVLETPFGLLLVVTTLSFLQCAVTLWRCVSERSWFLCSGPLISLNLVFSDLCWSLLASSAFICLLSLICSFCVCLYSAAPEVGCWRPGEKTPCRRFVLVLLRISTIRLPRNFQQLKLYCVYQPQYSKTLRSNTHIRCNVYFGGRCVRNIISVTIYIYIYCHVYGCMTYKTGSGLDDWICWHLNTHSSRLQTIQRYRYSTHFAVYHCTHTRILSLH